MPVGAGVLSPERTQRHQFELNLSVERCQVPNFRSFWFLYDHFSGLQVFGQPTFSQSLLTSGAQQQTITTSEGQFIIQVRCRHYVSHFRVILHITPPSRLTNFSSPSGTDAVTTCTEQFGCWFHGNVESSDHTAFEHSSRQHVDAKYSSDEVTYFKHCLHFVNLSRKNAGCALPPHAGLITLVHSLSDAS